MEDIKRIKCAAIRKNGVIYTGRNHSVILNNAFLFDALKDGEQGFITKDHEFVDRHEAHRIADNAGQIRDDTTVRHCGLTSEDLKPD